MSAMSSPSQSAEPTRDWLTVREVAEREGAAERTVIRWIADGRIDPPPQKTERSWLIPQNYKLVPP